ncbi:MAG: hypothetical protein ACLR23_13075 [Clostridia bacterium]
MKIKEMKVGTMIAVIVLAGIILMSVFAPLIAPYDPWKSISKIPFSSPLPSIGSARMQLAVTS